MAATGFIPWLTSQIKGIPSSIEGLPQAAEQMGQSAISDIASATEGGTPTPPLVALSHAFYDPNQPTNQPVTKPPKQTGPEPLSYQQIMNQSIAPLIKGGASLTSPTAVQKALAPYGGQGGSVGQNIASTLQSMTADYQTGLQTMLKYAGEQDPTQAILKGMEELISYPVTGLTGQQGAPSGVETSPFLEQLYATLNQERSGIAPTATNAAGAQNGYNSSINNILANGA